MTDRMTNSEIEALCEALEKWRSPTNYDFDAGEYRPIPLVQQALTAIRQLQQPWKPIETAPDDGEMIVTNGTRTQVAFRDTGMSSYRFFSSLTEGDLPWWPTHWMPLPPAPETGE